MKHDKIDPVEEARERWEAIKKRAEEVEVIVGRDWEDHLEMMRRERAGFPEHIWGVGEQ